jgi:hypothetical protein
MLYNNRPTYTICSKYTIITWFLGLTKTQEFQAFDLVIGHSHKDNHGNAHGAVKVTAAKKHEKYTSGSPQGGSDLAGVEAHGHHQGKVKILGDTDRTAKVQRRIRETVMRWSWSRARGVIAEFNKRNHKGNQIQTECTKRIQVGFGRARDNFW